MNAILAKYGIVVSTHASTRYVSHGQYGGHNQPYLQLMVYELDPSKTVEMGNMARPGPGQVVQVTTHPTAPAVQTMVYS